MPEHQNVYFANQGGKMSFRNLYDAPNGHYWDKRSLQWEHSDTEEEESDSDETESESEAAESEESESEDDDPLAYNKVDNKGFWTNEGDWRVFVDENNDGIDDREDLDMNGIKDSEEKPSDFWDETTYRN